MTRPARTATMRIPRITDGVSEFTEGGSGAGAELGNAGWPGHPRGNQTAISPA